MKKLNVKSVILWTLAMILCVTACGPAFAAAGDRVVYRLKAEDDGMNSASIGGAWRIGDGFCVQVREDGQEKILRYKDRQSEPETFVLEQPDYSSWWENPELYLGNGTEETEPEASPEPAAPEGEAGADEEEDEEDDEDSFLVTAPKEQDKKEEQEEENIDTSYMNYVFSWKDELYSLSENSKYDMEANRSYIDSISITHVKLEDGKVILEPSGLPKLDPTYLVHHEPDWDYMNYINYLFTTGKYLVGQYYGEQGQVTFIIDLTDGSARDMDTGYNTVFPGPDGTVLLPMMQEGEDNKLAAAIRKINLETMEEEQLATVSNFAGYQMKMCYDEANNTLYYLDSGRLWAMPDMDPEKAAAVNDCSESDMTMTMLPDGYILLHNYKSVMIKGTDPSQQAGITLNILNGSYNDEDINEAVFEMGNARSDVSVILKQREWNDKTDILQLMMNRDAQTDIYVLEYKGNEFKALRNRDYLTDLSGNAQIAGYVERMYPYLRDALKKDGKITAIPLEYSTTGITINPTVWKAIGGTEEQLPKTWDQFFDWLPEMKKRLEGTDYVLMDDYMSISQFRGQMVQSILADYQVMMDSKGEAYSFNTPMLKDVLTRVAELDYEALGLQEDVDFNTITEWHQPLLDSMDYRGFYAYSEAIPLPLSFSEEEPAIIPVEFYAAFVNPYSEHPEEAKELLAMILKSQNIYTQYTLYTDKTEAIERSDANKQREDHEKEMKALQEMLEKAEDAEEKTSIEEWIRSNEKYWEENGERYLWVIGQDKIDTYQKCLPAFRVQEYDIFNDLWGDYENQEYQKIQAGLYGFTYGKNEEKVSLEEALSLIDQKIQMKRLEGN